MFREARQRSTRKQLEKDRLDPKKSHKPEPPVSGPGREPVWFSPAFIGAKRRRLNKQIKVAQDARGRDAAIVTQLFLKHSISHVFNWMNARICLRQMSEHTVVDVLEIMQSS